MYGRSFGTADGDYVVPERYGGTVYKRPLEKAEQPKKEPRVIPSGGEVRLSQMAAEMHGQDIRRITGEETAETSADDPPAETPTEEDAAVSPREKQGKKRLSDISEEELFLIGLMILMLGGDQPHGGQEPEQAAEKAAFDTAVQTEEQAAPSEAPAASASSGDDILIPLLLTLLIW